jgi:hypothetical protein
MRKKNKKPRKEHTNPLLEKQQHFLNALSENDKNNFFSNSLVTTDRRAELWMAQADVGGELVDKYSWATPDERAIRILKEFSPVVEIGCGANAYWCRAMKGAGIDVIGYDVRPLVGGKIQNQSQEGPEMPSNFKILNAGPEVLAKQHLKNRTLFLCYPDEDVYNKESKKAGDIEDDDSDQPQSLGSACLEYFQGKHIIHVGELYGETLSVDQAPWGRSSGPDFQQRLATEFHCILRAQLTNWLHVRDTISVWRRSETTSIVFDADGDDEEEEVEYRHIPKDEVLPVDLAAPCMLHLLENKTSPNFDPSKNSTDTEIQEKLPPVIVRNDSKMSSPSTTNNSNTIDTIDAVMIKSSQTDHSDVNTKLETGKSIANKNGNQVSPMSKGKSNSTIVESTSKIKMTYNATPTKETSKRVESKHMSTSEVTPVAKKNAPAEKSTLLDAIPQTANGTMPEESTQQSSKKKKKKKRKRSNSILADSTELSKNLACPW